MTFNVRGAFAEDGVNTWRQRASMVITLMQRYRPDVVGFQEVHQANLETFRAHLPNYDFFPGKPYDFPERHAYNAIFWRQSAFHLLDAASFYLSPRPQVAWSVGWDAALPRSAAWVKLAHRESGVSFGLMNVHFDHFGKTARQESGKLVRERLDALCGTDLPAILTGDFNANAGRTAVSNPSHSLHQSFLASGYVDCFLAAGYTDSQTTYSFHGFQGADYRAADFHNAQRIDWILTHNGRYHPHTLSCQIIRDADPPRYPSDHYPLLAELDFIPAEHP